MFSTALAVVVSASLVASPGDSSRPFEPPSRWELGAAAGGGWDSNPLAETSSSASGFGSARAWVARRFDLSDSDELQLQLHYDGLRYEAAPAADLDRPELGIEWAHVFGERVLLRVIGRGAIRSQGDSARDGTDGTGRVLLRVAVGSVVGLRLGLGGFYRDAKDTAFAGGSGRLDGGVDVALWRQASMVAGYSVELGTDFAPSGSMGARGQGRVTSALATATTRHALAADLFQALPGGFFTQGGYGYSIERGAGFSAEAHLALLEVGWRR